MKKEYLIIVYFIVIKVHAQSPLKVWDSTLGSSSGDIPYSIVAANDGGYVIAGYSYSSGISGDKTDSGKGSFDYWIVKINRDGQKVWDKTFGGNEIDYPRSALATNDGGYVIAGYSYSGISGDKTEPNRGNGSDYWIIKLDRDGEKVWDKTLGGSSHDNAQSIVATSDGGFVIAGNSLSGYSGDKTSGTNDFTSCWLVKINSSGQKVWDKQFDGYDRDTKVSSIIKTSDNGFVVVGSTPINYLSTSYRIVKLDNLGNVVWRRTIGSLDTDRAKSVVETNDGGFLVVGDSYHGISGDKTNTGMGGGFNPWMVKLNSSGQKLWDKALSTKESAFTASIISAANGGYIIAGYSSSWYGISGDKSEAGKGGDDYWVIKIDDSGQKIWDKTIGSNGTDVAQSIAATLDGEFVIAGYSYGGISADKTQSSRGGDGDYWVVKITDGSGSSTSISTPSFSGTAFCANTTLSVSFTTTGTFNSGNQFNILLSDANGSFASPQIIGTSSNAGSVSCTISTLASGGENYRIRVVSTNPVLSGNDNNTNLTVYPQTWNLVSPGNNIASGTVIKKAVQAVNADNSISGESRVEYKAGNSINLNQGFQVTSTSGSSFKAQIETCP